MNTDAKKRDVALVVDDSPETLRLLTDALDGAGMTVMVAMDGAAALRIVERITPDIILLDAVMPGMDGFETCRRLKREVGLSDVPVIFLTGLTETENIVQGLQAGGVDYVAKPIVVEEMLARIRVHLGNARLMQSARNALDVSGRYLLAVNLAGRIMWATPQAQRLMIDALAADAETLVLPEAALSWIARLQDSDLPKRADASIGLSRDNLLRLHFIGKVGNNELLLQLSRDTSPPIAADFGKRLGLTSREGEVLSWLSKGKTNRDIAQILGLSPRTVDKHLEQIYAKLGVENRTAAAAVAAHVQRME